MIDLSTVQHFQPIEEITDVLCKKKQSTDKAFFRTIVTYYIGKMAACMRANIVTKHLGTIPINTYVLALAPSGYGKNFSVNFMEENIIRDFRVAFLQDTMPAFAQKHLADMATTRSVNNHTSQAEEIKLINQEYNKLGSYLFTFDSATGPAIKQMRQKLLMAGIGSINLQIDEIGMNLTDSGEALNMFLELFDKGFTKQKLTKNTDSSSRGEDLDGSTPANMLLFGEPYALLDGGTIEDNFYAYLRTGYARRTLFCMGKNTSSINYQNRTPKEIYDDLCDPQNDAIAAKWSSHFASLADQNMYNYSVNLPNDIGIKLQEYKMECEEKAEKFKASQLLQKTEVSNRYFKALKLAGAFAFVDVSPDITETHLNQAIKLVEESGNAFTKILTRDLPHMKLAKFISEQTHEVTHAEIVEELPFFKGSSNKKDMLSLAKAWGLDHNILITSRYNDDIEFLSGKQLNNSSGDNSIISYSTDFAFNYYNDELSWDNLKQLGTMESPDKAGEPLHFCNHHFACEINGNGHRCNEDVIGKFNTIILDIDDGTPITLAQNVLEDYSYIIYTTKRHTAEQNRYRILIPMSHELELSKEEFSQFMSNILTYLPFTCDEMVKDISHKWETNPKGIVFDHQGKLFNVLPFIPGSRSNDIYNKQFKDKKLADLGALERWFIQKMDVGNRNNYMLRYTMALVDSGKSLEDVEKLVKGFNKRLPNPLPEEELANTCLKTAAKKIGDRTNE